MVKFTVEHFWWKQFKLVSSVVLKKNNNLISKRDLTDFSYQLVYDNWKSFSKYANRFWTKDRILKYTGNMFSHNCIVNIVIHCSTVQCIHCIVFLDLNNRKYNTMLSVLF